MIALLLAVTAIAAQPGPLPDPALTPGETDPAITQTTIRQTICIPGYTGKVRHVTEGQKRQVCQAYHFECRTGRQEIDHLISLELGGSNSNRNLWPEPYLPRPGAHEKDQVENELHREICHGKLALEAAQHIIATNWLEFYREMKSGKGRGKR